MEGTIDPNDHDSFTSSNSNRIARHLKMEMLKDDRFILNSSEMRGAQLQLSTMNSSSNRDSRRNTKETVNDAPTTGHQIGKAVIEIT